MLDIWTNLSPAQSSLLSTMLVIFAGGIGILLSSLLFGGRVKNLETALQASEMKIKLALSQSAETVEKHNKVLGEKLVVVDEQLGATLEMLGQLRSGVSDLQDTTEQNADNLRVQLKEHWHLIRDELEKAAANPEIHGKTRLRYSKIPRYDPTDLIDAMCRDMNMDAREEHFRAAAKLWNWHRNGKAPLALENVQQMGELAQRVLYRPGLRIVR
ncbi:MAG TPA: hypothetical protein VGO52_00245 [Hyphomonadaceae bacterium]|jgi:hypothetical protein|nr:hypothetical protein [Hyphomonadaceae bacterium]